MAGAPIRMLSLLALPPAAVAVLVTAEGGGLWFATALTAFAVALLGTRIRWSARWIVQGPIGKTLHGLFVTNDE